MVAYRTATDLSKLNSGYLMDEDIILESILAPMIKVIKSMSQATDSINEVINDLIVFADALKMAKTDDPATDDDEAKMTVSEGLALAQCALEVVSSFSDMLRAMKEDPEAFAEALRSLKAQDETQPPV